MSRAGVHPDDQVAIAAAKLKRAVPKMWGEFEEALTALGEKRKNDCIQANFTEVQRAQGRAIEAMELLKVLAECLATSDRLQSRQQPK